MRALLGPDMRSRERGTDRLGSLSDASEITENALAKGTRSSRTMRSVEASPYATASPIVTSRRVANACSAKSVRQVATVRINTGGTGPIDNALWGINLYRIAVRTDVLRDPRIMFPIYQSLPSGIPVLGMDCRTTDMPRQHTDVLPQKRIGIG